MLHPPKVELQEIIKKKIKRERDIIIIFLRDNNKFIENQMRIKRVKKYSNKH